MIRAFRLRLVAPVFLLLVIPAQGLGQLATKGGPEVAPLQLCLARAADYSPVYPTQTFPAGATNEVTAVLRLDKGESYTTMTATWIAVDVGDVSPPNTVIHEILMQVKGKDRAAARWFIREGVLPEGKYRLDVAADGKHWRSVEFAIAVMPPAAEVKEPKDLLPLTEGTVWRYGFEQEFAPGLKFDLPPGLKLDADGKLRATVTYTVAKKDSVGTHIEIRRNNELVMEEWWRLTEAGLAMVQIKQGNEVVKFDPPHAVWPWPLEAPREWVYEPEDKSFKQTYRMWGPVPVKGPTGEALGYVVLTEQPSPSIIMTVERHYLPGVGLVREVIIQAHALRGVMLSRQEYVLREKP